LKFTYWGNIVALIVIAAMVCGCASGPGSSPVPTGTPTGYPTAVPGMVKSGLLFDMGGLNWYEYRVTTPGESGQVTRSDIRFDYTTTVIGGTTVRDDRITMKVSEPDMILTLDTYYDPVTDRQIGSQKKMVSNDITVSDQDLVAAGDQYRNRDIAGTFATGDWPLADLGTEAVTVDGKTYTCTKFSVGDAGEYGMAWVARGVPVPVKIESKSAVEGTSTWELLGWG
jgi:hypothetical protein